MKKIAIIGAGPGGLTAGMILAKKGFQVDIYEKKKRVGGRNGCLDIDGYKFDIGPTFLMMRYVLDEVFNLAGKRSEDYLDFLKLDPMYRLQFSKRHLDVSSDPRKMREEIAKVFPGEEENFDKFLRKEKIRFDKMIPCLQVPYSSASSMLSKNLMRALPHLSLGKSVHQVLDSYFKSEELKLAFSFQTKYLGMSAWQCPGAFMLLPYIEHAFGVYHVQGGLSVISDAMAKVVEENGGKIHLNAQVQSINNEGKDIKSLTLVDGTQIKADEYIVNADFAHAMDTLPVDKLKKYSKKNLKKKKYSCSTFMLYLGLDKVYDLPHHTIFFSDDYKENIEKIFETKQLAKDTSFYVRNSSVNDPNVAPKGHSAIYVLVPVANKFSEIDWKKETDSYKELVLDAMEKRGGMKDLRKHIKVEKIINPDGWNDHFDVYAGATFNLAHTLDQMLYLRPRNKFEELNNCYLVGGGTHPGSGLPTIYESGRIVAEMIKS